MPWREGPLFTDRSDAGRRLAEALFGVRLDDPVVLALPRGGVPLGLEIARRLRAPLDLLLVRKIGAPGNCEYGIGAVIDGKPPQRVIDDDAVRYARAEKAYIEAETQRQIGIMADRRALYLSGRKSCDLRRRNIVVVDDGIATGSTVRAALKGLGGLDVASVTLAVPVAPVDVAAKLGAEVDRFICLETPDDFRSVGEYYRDFRQVTDDEVIAFLREQDQPERGTPSSPPRSS